MFAAAKNPRISGDKSFQNSNGHRSAAGSELAEELAAPVFDGRRTANVLGCFRWHVMLRA
jgi:hypothetical protein